MSHRCLHCMYPSDHMDPIPEECPTCGGPVMLTEVRRHVCGDTRGRFICMESAKGRCRGMAQYAHRHYEPGLEFHDGPSLP